jgi:hypothetical protein
MVAGQAGILPWAVHYPKESARKSAWQFLYKTNDPRLSMLRKFAKAMGVSVSRLIGPKN